MDNESPHTLNVTDPDSKAWVRPFFTIWSGQMLSLVGSHVGGFALVWWLTQASGGSATMLAMATFIAMLPGVILGPFIGALVDRWNRRRVMIIADSVIAAFSALLALLSLLGVAQIWHVYILMFILVVATVLNGFVNPAFALMPILVRNYFGGYFNPIVNGPFFAILQDVVDPAIQGRVFTVITSISGAAAPLGMLVAGPLADKWGVQLWFLLGGIVTVACAVVMRITPSVMHMEDHKYTV